MLWRAGLRIHEALALGDGDLDRRRASLLVRRGKGGRRREVGMDQWGWEQLQTWLDARAALPVGPLFCIVTGPTRGRAWSNTAVRTQLRDVAARAGVRRRFAPHQLRPAHAVEMAREGVPDRHPTPAWPHQPRRDVAGSTSKATTAPRSSLSTPDGLPPSRSTSTTDSPADTSTQVQPGPHTTRRTVSRAAGPSNSFGRKMPL